MLKKRHGHKSHLRSESSQEGFIAESSSKKELISNELKKSMNKNEKVIMGILVVGILVFLSLSILVLFGKSKQKNGITNEVPTVPTNMVTHKLYPTIAPVEDTTVMVNSRRFNPSVATIPRGGFIEFINIDQTPMTIEGNDGNSSMLNIGTFAAGDTKQVIFSAPGTYTYRNKDKPTMTGIIIIK